MVGTLVAERAARFREQTGKCNGDPAVQATQVFVKDAPLGLGRGVQGTRPHEYSKSSKAVPWSAHPYTASRPYITARLLKPIKSHTSASALEHPLNSAERKVS
jgi:hypothetical protein